MMRGFASGQRGRDSESSPSTEQLQNLYQYQQLGLRKIRCRHSNWKDAETTALIKCLKEGGKFRKGKRGGTIMNWEAIRIEIVDICGSTRTPRECQRRTDTLIKTYNLIKNTLGGKQFFEKTEEKRVKRPAKLPTLFTLEWYEDLEQIKQQKQQKPRFVSSSDSGGSPCLRGTQTRSRSDLVDDAGRSGTDLISSPDPTQVQDPADPIQTHSFEWTDLIFQEIPQTHSFEWDWPDLHCQETPQGPATPNRTGAAQEEYPNLHDGQDSGALRGLDHAPCDQEVQDCDCAQWEDIHLTIEEREEFSSIIWHWVI